MSPKPLHFRLKLSKLACGVSPSRGDGTSDPREVTCVKCKKHYAFIKGLPLAVKYSDRKQR